VCVCVRVRVCVCVCGVWMRACVCIASAPPLPLPPPSLSPLYVVLKIIEKLGTFLTKGGDLSLYRTLAQLYSYSYLAS
jgi:hypothetical protein